MWEEADALGRERKFTVKEMVDSHGLEAGERGGRSRPGEVGWLFALEGVGQY